MIFSSSSSSWALGAAMVGGVEAGRGESEEIFLSFTKVLGRSPSSSNWKNDMKMFRAAESEEAVHEIFHFVINLL